MCTVTFLPLDTAGFVLTSNRDEQHSRPSALAPQTYTVRGIPVVFPKDTQAGGTWIASSGEITICLLNGAFDRHQSQPPYRQSRGLMMLDFWQYDTPQAFMSHYEFQKMEPFTLIIVEHQKEVRLTEIRWTDTGQLFASQPDSRQPHIWSSATLYPAPVRQQRTEWFTQWLANQQTYSTNAIMDFHLLGGTGDTANDLRMHRNAVATVSITSITHQNSQTCVYYHDLRQEQITKVSIDYQPLTQTH